MNQNFIVSPSPHVHSGNSIPNCMYNVLIALIPAFLVSLYFFGVGALVVTLTSVAACVLFEYLIQNSFESRTYRVGRFGHTYWSTVGLQCSVESPDMDYPHRSSRCHWYRENVVRWIRKQYFQSGSRRPCLPAHLVSRANDNVAQARCAIHALPRCRNGCDPTGIAQTRASHRSYDNRYALG